MPRILEFWELREHGVTYTREHLYRLEKAGKFPKRVPTGEFRVGWIEQEIDDWVDEKIRSRSTDAGTIGSKGTIKRRGSKTPAPGDVVEKKAAPDVTRPPWMVWNFDRVIDATCQAKD